MATRIADVIVKSSHMVHMKWLAFLTATAPMFWMRTASRPMPNVAFDQAPAEQNYIDGERRRARRGPSPNVTVAISMAIYGMAMCGVMLLIGLSRYGSTPSLGQFLLSRGGTLCVVAVLGFVVTGGVLVRSLCGLQRRNRDRVYVVLMNLLSIVLIGGCSEIALRTMTVQKLNGTFVGTFHLLPRQWREYADRQLAYPKAVKSFVVDDDTLGWTVGPNRRSVNGLYESSVEGLRSARQGAVLREGLGACRVALVGDSFTFGNDVRFEGSWGYRLEQLLPKGCRVLNFGVSGYGIDQMYLRYKRDVPSWKPNLVILSFIEHDLPRAMSSSAFLLFDGEFPFMKPRFVLDQAGKLDIVNEPLPKAEDIFMLPYIQDIPFIEYDRFYRRTEWDRPRWWYVHRSYLLRFLTSIYPLHEEDRPFVSDSDMRAINQSLLNSFVDAVHQDGATPLLIYLPSNGFFENPPARLPQGLRILQNAKLEHVDLTACVAARVSEPNRFVPVGVGRPGHYTPQANAAVAACLGPTIRDRLGLQRRNESSTLRENRREPPLGLLVQR